MIKLIKYIWQILKQGLWNVRLDKEKPVVLYVLKVIRIFSLTSKKFIADKCLTHASALTYYTFFSIVPLVALAFAIAKGFGLEKELEKNILEQNPEYSYMLANVFEYANTMLKAAKGGVIAGAGVLLLLYSVISLLNNIENVFNQIWEAKQSRNWFRKIADYVAIIIFAPIFLIVSSSITVLAQTKLSSLLFSTAAVIGIKLISLALLILVFFFVFKALTSVFVSTKSAFFSAFISALLFQVLQWAYINFQIGVSRYNAIYGSFAAVPLFLIFIQYSWYLVLFGGELAYAHQYVDKFELEAETDNMSFRLRKIFSIMVLNKILNHFIQGQKGLKINEISEKLDMPNRLVQSIIQDLIDTELIIEIKQEDDDSFYIPLKPDYQITVSKVIQLLETKGVNDLPIEKTKEYEATMQIVEKVKQTIENNFGNLLVKDIVC